MCDRLLRAVWSSLSIIQVGIYIDLYNISVRLFTSNFPEARS